MSASRVPARQSQRLVVLGGGYDGRDAGPAQTGLRVRLHPTDRGRRSTTVERAHQQAAEHVRGAAHSMATSLPTPHPASASSLAQHGG
jgi:hypothetical protein